MNKKSSLIIFAIILMILGTVNLCLDNIVMGIWCMTVAAFDVVVAFGGNK
jgi:hypothetical protein